MRFRGEMLVRQYSAKVLLGSVAERITTVVVPAVNVLWALHPTVACIVDTTGSELKL